MAKARLQGLKINPVKAIGLFVISKLFIVPPQFFMYYKNQTCDKGPRVIRHKKLVLVQL
jgi:hypothetical protein